MIHGNEKLLPRVTDVETKPDYVLIVAFSDGEKKIFNAKPMLEIPMYKKLTDVFSEAKVEYGTVIWPGDIDISPEKLYLQGVSVNC